jgi:rhodanese-related sulfurtransferase
MRPGHRFPCLSGQPAACRPNEDAFVELLLGSYPRCFLRLREANRRPCTAPARRRRPSLPPEQVRRLVAGGAELVDARPVAAFAAGHVPGAVSLPDGPLAVVCGHGERAMTATSLLARQVRRDVMVVDGGTSAWAGAGRRLEPRA